MSDEPTPKVNGAEWKMPEPVFRSTEGRTPEAAKSYADPDDIDTESPDSDEYNADDIDTEIPNLGEADDIEAEIAVLNVSDTVKEDINIPEEIHTVRAASPKTVQPKRGCAKNFLLVVGVIIFLALALVVAAVYLLFYVWPAETGTF